MVEHDATFLLVGTGHWGNPGLDMAIVEFDDMLAPSRQREIAGCVDQLSRFAPTKVAVELLPEVALEFTTDYLAYQNGTLDLRADEIHQLGFRLAERANLPAIFGIDWHHLSRPIGWEHAIDFAIAHDQRHLVAEMLATLEASTESRIEKEEQLRLTSVRDLLLQFSSPESMANNHRVYMDLALVGDEDCRIGAEVILRWYERNMMMFTNLARLATEPGDRVLLVVGAAHLTLLTQFLTGTNRFAVEHVSTYLDGDA